MWVATEDLPRSAAHPFYRRLNQIFDQDDFSGYVEGLCQRFLAHKAEHAVDLETGAVVGVTVQDALVAPVASGNGLQPDLRQK